MTTQINITDYLTQDEIKEICIEETRVQIQKLFANEKEAQRLLSNLSYELVFNEIDKAIPNSRQMVIDKTASIVGDIKSYQVFRGASYGSAKSLGYTIMENAIRENKDLINEKVTEAIINRDYTEDVWTKFEELSDTFISNIYEIVRLGRETKKS